MAIIDPHITTLELKLLPADNRSAGCASLPDPRGAGHVEAFQFLSICLSVCLSKCPDIKLQDLSLALRSHDQFQASHWMMDDG